MADTVASTAQEENDGHKALLELEAQFHAKSRNTFFNVQGSQIYALTSFTRIFEQYPYPVVINAAILKLADWFRTNNNIVKYYVFKVFKDASDQHLAKVFNIEETVRRIMTVLGSNDPIARSITLRILGCMAKIVSEKLEVHHAILQRLEAATGRIEIEAAIWASDNFCASSLRFPSVIFPKLSAKVQDPTISLDVKLRYIKIFRHMHRDIAMARQAKTICLGLLDNPNTEEKLVIVTLRTLTLLLSKALMDRKEQIDRLLYYALHDNRISVQYSALYDVVLLGKNDIMFDETNILQLLRIVNTMSANVRLQQQAYKCAHTLILAHQQLIIHIFRESTVSTQQQEYMQSMYLCEERLVESVRLKRHGLTVACARILAASVKIALPLTQQLPTSKNDMQVDNDRELASQMEKLGMRLVKILDEQISCCKIEDESSITRLRVWLKLKASLCRRLSDWDCDKDFQNTYQTMADHDYQLAYLFLPYLSNIATRCSQLSTWLPNRTIEVLKTQTRTPVKFVNMLRLLLRTTDFSTSLRSLIIPLLHDFGEWNASTKVFQTNCWQLYLISIEAGICGWYQVMHSILRDLSKSVETEACRYWLRALSLVAAAEGLLPQHDAVDQKCYAIGVTDSYLKAITQFKAFETLTEPRVFQVWFVQLRMEMVNILQGVRGVLQQVRNGETMSDKPKDLMFHYAAQFRRLAFRYDFIAQSFFGMDREALAILESYKICALTFEHAARTLFSDRDTFFCIDPSLIPILDNNRPLTNFHDSNQRFSDACTEFLRTVIEWEELDEPMGDARLMRCVDDMDQFARDVLKCSLILPRCFFEHQKNITVQLTIDPMLNEQQPIQLKPHEDLIIRFEGLIQNAKKTDVRGRIRKAAIICFLTKEKLVHFDDRLGVSMIFADPLAILNQQTTLMQPPVTFIAKVNNSYFTYTGLLTLPKCTVGPTELTKQEAWINVFVKLIDDNSEIWATGPQQCGRVVW